MFFKNIHSKDNLDWRGEQNENNSRRSRLKKNDKTVLETDEGIFEGKLIIPRKSEKVFLVFKCKNKRVTIGMTHYRYAELLVCGSMTLNMQNKAEE